ncbi:MAG: polymerase beta domain protein region protein [Candidatus Falkowbacteria bacterium GW2011_GWC2_38_22]|uniref:Polymerase beta domain protein region protein n=1 Tax=Candidatus Falkowbacteria bacterium GW2011_GWE1_38_31 TaxID=1618638 RepID=A0A0G0K4J4_9BACT|nr:MAG: polymerase beta domain protein region protein [Candidatus Falkowbacteria bacterium GW2011_GWF2_38_1205]KKQ61501.1 MAG: polymerase beta domain protein region protein [Candidatus Falkowbacteria bacterium GW2011_GWC2_38_22]KKQ63606.1 MAG: polymerase beta domain protein region protein [Candidatus Falkowbacteria bacterium GW2011_GWF1_38_22]KKQ65758.1 MAG: polymerase beta domain protein region protein [Candidatus Falkowbacteria bacterium GW2011_GWE2_38_254]KKQ70375.1 MAG: polymerase beta doma
MTTRVKNNELKKIVSVIKEKYKPEKIILFGSLAWGKATEDSDIDLFVVKNTKKARRERNRDVSRLLIDRKVAVDILVYTPSEVKERRRLGDFFIENILNSGKLLYAKK